MPLATKKKKFKLLFNAMLSPIIKCLPTIIDEGLDSPKQQRSLWRRQQQWLGDSSDLDAVSMAVMFGSLYSPRGPKQAGPPSFYKEEVRKKWRPQCLDPAELAEQQLIESEAERPYNRRWIEHYRITYEGFQYIKKGIAALIRAAPNPIGGPKPMSPGEQLSICLFWLAQGGEYRATGTTAGRSRPSVHRCVNKVCKAINRALGRTHIRFPSSKAALEKMAEGFEKLGATNGDKGLKQVVGAIDGSHIPISRPRNTVDEYCNRKKTFSVLLQAVCDHEGRFTDVYTGWTGRIHDARMLRESGLGKALLSVQMNPRQASMLSSMIPLSGKQIPFMLTADSAYGSTRFILPAFKHSTTAGSARRKRFNRIHARTRNIIERAFGRLKQRFRVLMKPQMLLVRNVAQVITACCVLHNICHKFKCARDQDDVGVLEADVAQHQGAAAGTGIGAEIRKALVDYVNP